MDHPRRAGRLLHLFARTGEGSRGISCFLVPGDLPGLTLRQARGEDGAARGADHLGVLRPRPTSTPTGCIGEEGQGLQIAFSALDSGRLGIAAVAVGLAQAALDEATAYANERTTFGRKIIDHQGLGFVLADMAAAVASARATYLDAARRRDLGRPYSAQASVAKLIATDAAMKVTTDAVQVFGGVGYTRDYRVERYMREAKITQIFEGTNQIQRLVIARGLDDELAGSGGEVTVTRCRCRSVIRCPSRRPSHRTSPESEPNPMCPSAAD